MSIFSKKSFKMLALLIVATLFVSTAFMPVTTVKAATKPTSIILNYTKKQMVVGQKVTLKVLAVKPAKAANSVTWKSSDTSVATVSKAGVIKAKKKGTATITAVSTADKSVKAKCKVTVLKYKVPTLTLEEADGTWSCGKDLLQKMWKEMYPYWAMNLGLQDKISDVGIIWQWDKKIDNGDKVDYSAETNTVYMGPLPHHRNLDPNNHYDYEPLVDQMIHETGHMWNSQGDEIVRVDFGQWAWEALSIIAQIEYRVGRYGEVNMSGESHFDMINFAGWELVNGTLYDSNKYSRDSVDYTAADAFYYMSCVLSAKGTYNYWKKVYKARMDNYKATGNTQLSWDEFAVMLDDAAGGKAIDGMAPSKWLKSKSISNIEGTPGDYMFLYPDRPADMWPMYYVSCFNRYKDETGTIREKAYTGTEVSYKIEDATGKVWFKGTTKTQDNGYVFFDNGNLDDSKLKDNTMLKCTATATFNGQTHTAVTYQIFTRNQSKDDGNSTYIMLLDKDGNIRTDIKASDIKISGALTKDTKSMDKGTIVLLGEIGTTYTIKYNGKTYKISQPECRRVYPLVLE